MIIAYPPGGGTDLIARALAPYVEKNLGGGAKIVIVNRAGAGGEVGFAALATAPADGARGGPHVPRDVEGNALGGQIDRGR
jgi:tripartite-type tricarboxylate transporter receptor subunit TctC